MKSYLYKSSIQGTAAIAYDVGEQNQPNWVFKAVSGKWQWYH